MTDDSEQYVKSLQDLRELHVAERRQAAKTSAELRAANGDGGLFGDQVKRQQEIIEAIDRAIADEMMLPSKPPTAQTGIQHRV